MTNIVEKELSYEVTGHCFKVQDKLGRFAREKQYCDELENRFKEAKIKYQREYTLTKFISESPKGNRVDFLVEGRVVVDCKAKNFITKEDYYQMQRYLDSAKLELGLIVNFRDAHLKPKRVLNSSADSSHSDESSDSSDRL